MNTALFWFRRDLRVHDNTGLHHALQNASKVWCVFVLDTDILDALPKRDRRVDFIVHTLTQLDTELRALNPKAGLIVRHASSKTAIARLASDLHVQAVYANHDDEPQALARDQYVRGQLSNLGIALHTSKDHVIFERSEILTASGTPYSVFTPYKNAWLKKITLTDLQDYSVHHLTGSLADLPPPFAWQADTEKNQTQTARIPTLQDIGFEPTNLHTLKLGTGSHGAQLLLQDFLPRMHHYDHARDFPATKGPSYLSMHLRFGTISIRELARKAMAPAAASPGASIWLSELIWRDFYHQILYHHPRVINKNFKPAYDAITWEKGKPALTLFDAWCLGRTGYPLIDAAMAQINQTGYMHNRLRMVVASFLVKDLGIDWRWGENYFATHLNDFDLAANNGGWQWAASTGCDAQPYFRIFNPTSQSEKFDAQGKFIRRYLPQLAPLSDKAIHAPWLASPSELAHAGIHLGSTYPRPIVAHEEARQKTLARYAVVKQKI
jgi:deoxyribodipyrimidine photo-lyase